MKFQILIASLCLLFLASCASDSTSTTTGGLKYQLIKNGDGQKANDGDYVSFHINYLADENEQYNSRDQGQANTLKIGEVGRGDIVSVAMNECISMMSVGDSLALFIPTDSLVSLGFPPTDTTKQISYLVKVTDIQTAEDFEAKANAERAELEAKAAVEKARLPEIENFVAETYRYIASGKGGENILKTDSGIEYIIHEEGNGAKLEAGEQIEVQYYGVFKSTGVQFDNSFKTGNALPLTLGAGQVIRGWDEGLQLLNKGSRATLIIPYSLAYGEAGRPPSIPEKSDLVFYVEISE